MSKGLRARTTSRRGFTLIELAVALLVIVLLVSLAMVAIGRAVASGRAAAERATVVSMKMACTQFISDFSIDVPMVEDDAPLTSSDTVNIRGRDFLSFKNVGYPEPATPTTPAPVGDRRFSELSLAYFLTGVLPAQVDGKDGPGFTAVSTTEDLNGTFAKFKRSGKTFGPYTDVEKDRRRLTGSDSGSNSNKFVDRWGNPLRYYLWRETPDDPKTPQNEKQYNAPRLLGDPDNNAAVRGARFAIVSLGPDGQTDERGPFPGPGGDVGGRTLDGELDPTAADDIVEVGQ